MNLKIKCLREKLKSLNMEGMIISNPINIRYLTNIEAEGILLITRKENVYITDGRYIEKVQRTLTIEDDIIITDIKNVSEYDYENFFMYCENVGFEEKYVTYYKYREYMHKFKINNLVETEDIIEKQRAIKDSFEINEVTKACELTDRCFEHLLKFIKKGMTEKEIAFEIEKYFKENGADELAFPSIVASGINSSMPHSVPTDKKIESGDIITLDFGCIVNGYCSDMTRTIFVDFVQDYAKKIYDLVLKNQMLILEEMKEGANTKNLFKMVESDFNLYDYTLIHALGHGVGMEVHENPVIGSKREILLKNNMVITNEPGIYIPGKFGVRIEDTVLITKNGCINLTKSEKNYIVI